MRASVEYIKEKFDEFNKMCFDGNLRPLPFKTTSARTFLGQIKCRRDMNSDGTWLYSDFKFVVSTTFDLSEDVIDDVILHEMIHYYILSNQMQDTAIHGVLFKMKMQELNKRFNRNISIRYTRTKAETDTDKTIRQHLVCIARFKDGRIGLIVPSKTRLFRIWDDLARADSVVECNWYVSLNPFFNQFPRVNSAKF